MTKTEIAAHSKPKITKLTGLSLLKGMWEFARTPLKFSLKCAQEYGDIVDLSIGSNIAGQPVKIGDRIFNLYK